jgi:hypothetical protein
MTTLTTTDQASAVSTRVKIGLGLAILLGLANIPFVLSPTPDGQEGPPTVVLVFSLVIGVLSIITAVIAWRTGNTAALRITAACVIINALSSIPAFFVDVDAGIKVAVAVTILVSVASVVLMFSRSPDRLR